jgi:hypothetical protein
LPKAYHSIALEKIIALPQQATARSALGDHIPEGQISLIFKNVKKRLSSCGMVWQTENQQKIKLNFENLPVISLVLA